MTLIQSVILGTIEGFTEFLPISSTGHLIVASKFLGIEQTSVTKAYEVIIQFAAILAVFFNYKEKFSFSHAKLWIKIFVAFLPIAVVGFLFANQIKSLFSVHVVALMFITGGVVFLLVEKFYIPKERHLVHDVERVSFKQALFIGIAQIFALIPGTSRAGSSIIGALLAGLDRKASAEFSFLLAFPVMGAVTAYDLLKHYKEFLHAETAPLAVGFVTAFLVAFASIKLFVAYLERFTFVPFGIYRIAFGLLLLLLF